MIVKLDENGGTLQNTFFDKKKPAGNIFSSAMHLLNFSLQYVAGTVLIRFPTVLIFSKISLKGDKNARFLNMYISKTIGCREKCIKRRGCFFNAFWAFMAQLWSVKDHKLTISQIKEKMYFRVHTVGFYSKCGHFCPAFRDIIDESFLRFFNLTLVLLDLILLIAV